MFVASSWLNEGGISALSPTPCPSPSLSPESSLKNGTLAYARPALVPRNSTELALGLSSESPFCLGSNWPHKI